MTKNKISINLLAVFSILIISISLVQAAVVFSTGAATNIIVSKVLAASPQGQAVLAAYSWATNPEASAINLLDSTGNVYNALKVVQGADPLQMLGGMAISKAQGEVLGKIYESLPPEQKIAFLNAQEYASYAQQVFKYQPDSADAKNLMNQAEYDNKTGILKLKIPDGKGGYQEFLQIPNGWGMKSKEGIMTLTSSTIDQQFKFMDSVSAYLQKNGTIKIQGQEITEADFTTAKESTLKFGNNQLLSVPANTSVRYLNGTIEIEGKTFRYGNENVDIINKSIKIQGNVISGKFKINNIDVDGTISVEKNGYILHEGFAEKEKIRINVASEKDKVLIVNSNADVSSYEGNWIKIDEERLEIQSINGSKVQIAALAGNKLFNMETREYAKDEKDRLVKFTSSDKKEGFVKDEYGYKYKIIPNEKGLLGFKVNNGDSLVVKGRKGLVPEISHTSKGGYVKISNGRFDFTLDKEFKVDVSSISHEKTLNKIMEGKYQSVPFELTSPALDKNKLRIAATNQYAIIDKENEDRVVFNKYGIPIAAGDDQMQTIDQLHAKWQEKGMDIKIYGPDPLSQMLLGIKKFDKNEVSPYMVQVVDYWLETHPEAVTNIKTIEISDAANAAFTGKQSLLLGELIFDPYYADKLASVSTDRNFDKPLTIITHEYEHLLDDLVAKNDKEALGDLVNKEGSKLRPEMSKRASTIINKEDKIERRDVLNSLHNAVPELVEKEKKTYEQAKELFEKEGYEGYMRKYKYLKTTEDVDTNLKGQKDLYETYSKDTEIIDSIQKEGFNKTMVKYGDYIKECVYEARINVETSKKLFEYFAKKEEFKPLDLTYNDIVKSSKANLLESDRFKNSISKVVETLEKEKDSYEADAKKSAEDIVERFKKDPKKTTGLIIDQLSMLEHFGEISENIASLNKEVTRVVEEETGLPANYAFRDYGAVMEDWFVDMFGQGYKKENGLAELSSTYREESIGERKLKVNSQNPKVSDMYTKLTQVAFDSGKMQAEEYKAIMGNICKRKDCCDQKCKIYKLTCKC